MTQNPAESARSAGPTSPGTDRPEAAGDVAGRPDPTGQNHSSGSNAVPGAPHYYATPYGQTTPYGHLPSFTPQPPPGPSPARSSGKRLTLLVAVAVIAATVGGGVGGLVVHETSQSTASSPGDTLNQRIPIGTSGPQGAISQVASKVLPSVVQLAGDVGEGSGVVLSSDGLILTNAHVLGVARNGSGLTAKFQNGDTAPVSVVGSDPRSDVAVVKAEHVGGLTPIQLGNSDELQVGQQVVAVGSPLGLSGTVTSGIVSALNRPVTTQQERQRPQRDDLGGLGGLGGLSGFGFDSLPVQQTPSELTALNAIQTDAAINPGNSGGPLVDMQGRIVGLNSAIASLSAGGGQSGSIGLGFSIPINQAKRIADQLVATGHAQQAQLGVQVKDASPTGAQIVSVQPGSAAAKAGLQPGDLVTKVGKQLIDDSDALVATINSQAPSSVVDLTVRSGAGAPRTVPVTLGSVTVS